ncbi:phage portal protein [Sinorhizobium meliloti]|nr:phage portal protein [Sinorhizobium meliloti]
MKLLNIFRRGVADAPSAAAPVVQAMAGETQTFSGFDDPRFLEFVRGGGVSGASVSVREAMKNTAVFRCVSLISYAIGMLPLHLLDANSKEKVKDHPLYALLLREPNNWQTAFNFRQLMQRRALVNGNAYALIVRSGGRVIRLVPLDPELVTPRQRADWSVEYVYHPRRGAAAHSVSFGSASRFCGFR